MNDGELRVGLPQEEKGTRESARVATKTPQSPLRRDAETSEEEEELRRKKPAAKDSGKGREQGYAWKEKGIEGKGTEGEGERMEGEREKGEAGREEGRERGEGGGREERCEGL